MGNSFAQIPDGVFLENVVEIHIILTRRPLRKRHEFIDADIGNTVDREPYIRFAGRFQRFVRVIDDVHLKMLVFGKINSVGDSITDSGVCNMRRNRADAFDDAAYDAWFVKRRLGKKIDILGLAVIEVTGRKRRAAGKIKRVADERIGKKR